MRVNTRYAVDERLVMYMYGSQWQPYPAYQPQPAPYQFPTRQDRGMELLRVNGIEAARAYQAPPSSTLALFDSGQDLMYIKSTDAAGFSSIRTFSFQPYEETAQNPANSDYATKADLQALREEMLSYGKQSVRKSKQPAAEAADE